jgi:hypothetical protein
MHSRAVSCHRLAQVVDRDPVGVDLCGRREPVDEAALDEAGEDRRELPLLDRGAHRPLPAEHVLRRAAEVEDLAEERADRDHALERPILHRRVGDDPVGLIVGGLERGGGGPGLGARDEETAERREGKECTEGHASKRCIACATGRAWPAGPKHGIEGGIG